MEFLDNSDVVVINVLNDGPGSQSCQTWGENGDDRIPIIIKESPNGSGMLGDFNNWFSGSGDWNVAYSSPHFIFIDKDFRYVHLSGEDYNEIIDKIDELLDN